MYINFIIVASLMTGTQAVDQTGPQQGRTGSDRAVQQSAPVRAKRIDTRLLFPQVSNSVSPRGIVPENHKLHPGISGKASFSAVESRTETKGAQPGIYFPGLDFVVAVPADPDIAVGGEHIVQVVNLELGFFNKNGTPEFRQLANTFFSSVRVGSNLFDPKAIYDPIADRFVMIFLDGNGANVSNILFAISDDGDPNGTWFLYRIDAMFDIGGVDHWVDYPSLASNRDGYVISVNTWSATSPTRFKGSAFITVPKTEVLSGLPVSTAVIHEDDTYRLRLASVDDPASPYVYGAQRDTLNTLMLYAFSDIDTASPVIEKHRTGVAFSNVPPSLVPSTNGRFLETTGYAVLKTAWENGHLYVTYNHGISSSMVGVRWSDFDLRQWPNGANPALSQTANYTSPTINYYIGSIAANKHGDVSIIFTGSNNSITSDLNIATRVSSDPSATLSSPTRIASATGASYVSRRWGDYFDIEIDPVDGETFWGTGMVVNSSNLWDTHIVSWKVSSTSFLAPSSHSWLRGQHAAGDNASLVFDDDDYNSARAGLTLFPSESPAQLRAEATAPSGQVLDIEINVAAMVSTPGLTQDVHAWNFSTSEWVLIDSQAATTSESIQTVVVSGALSDFLETSTRKVRAKVQWRQTGLTLSWPWTVSVDQFEWEIRVR